MSSHRLDDLFAVFGPIRLKRFFGGEGIYAGEIMIGMAFDDIVYLTTNEETRSAFVNENCAPFKFAKPSTGEIVSTHWYAIPDRLYDDAEELAVWARAAQEAALTSKAAGRKRARASRPAIKK
ncbi:MAG TPA: TfoX/Sxy family protein [Rhizomicrobium sp.]|jgi:DNA transformation protein|nr:TfoX/Sxy family protein [Rhizomicrobium sp.]